MTLHLLTRPPHPAAPATAPVWKMLFDRQQALLHRRAGPSFGAALAALGLRREALPELPAVARLVAQRTGWNLRFAAAPPPEATYYAALARRELFVVSRLRCFAEFDQAGHRPDLFADLFGRVPLLLEPAYAAALVALGQAAALATTPAAAELLRCFAQATFERGLLASEGNLSYYGATLLTSARHLHAAAAAPPDTRRPLAQALPLLRQEAADTSAPPLTTYFVADGWDDLRRAIEQLSAELSRLACPTPGFALTPAGLLRRRLVPSLR